MNIAFEISPLLTASGTFGDKSGVYRYMMGLLKGMRNHIKKNKLDTKIVLFSFNPHFLKLPLNPEIFSLIDNKHVMLLRKTKVEEENKGFFIYIKRLINLKPNLFLKILNKAFFIKKILLNLNNRLDFIFYLKLLNKEFKKRKVNTIFHSETAFFNVRDYINIIVMYDLTPIYLSEFHRKETIDLKKRKLRFGLDYCKGLICISESTKNDLIKYSPIFKKKKIIIGYPGLDEVFQNKSNKKNTNSIRNVNNILKNYCGKIKSKKYILYYGTFEPRKNIIYLVKAFSDLIKEKQITSDFKLILIGGEGWGRVKKKIKDYINEEFPLVQKRNITVLNYVNDEYLIDFIKNAYAVVYPSIYEGFGLPVLEAMSQKTPVICSDSSSIPEVGENSVLYINHWDFFDLKDKIKYLIKHKGMAHELSRDGFNQSKKFTWENTTSKVFKLIKSL